MLVDGWSGRWLNDVRWMDIDGWMMGGQVDG